jgi:acid ceramidase/N-acylethanolamine-hydrolysing acid amidase
MWELFSKLIVNVEYYNGSERVFSVDTVAGSVFALTGVRHGAFSLNVDTRKAKDFSQDLISVLAKQAYPTVWLVRRVLEDQTTYAAAVQRMKTEIIGGPVYYIIAGAEGNEGTVLERDTNQTHAAYTLTDSTWFLVQTNYDRDLPEPIYDTRRVPAENKLKELGSKGFTEETLLHEVMFKWPNFNIATIMTAIICPKTGYHNTTVWYGSNPVQKDAPSLQME